LATANQVKKEKTVNSTTKKNSLKLNKEVSLPLVIDSKKIKDSKAAPSKI
jgi:hypothetical protein